MVDIQIRNAGLTTLGNIADQWTIPDEERPMRNWTENGRRLENLVGDRGFLVLKMCFNICYSKKNIYAKEIYKELV